MKYFLMMKNCRIRLFKYLSFMKFVTEYCIIGFKDELNVINNMKINGFSSLFCFEIFDLKFLKFIMIVV